jgi:hypothetical protein
VNYSPLLNWATASGRIDAAQRLRFADLLSGPAADEVVEALLDAQPDPKAGDFSPPLPWGIGTAEDAETLPAARVAAARGRAVLATKVSGFTHALSPHTFAAARPNATPPTAAGPSTVSVGGIEVDVPGPDGPQPTLFAGGDLPAMSVSGVDPAMLSRLPWQARPAAARAETRGEVFDMIERYTGPDGNTAAELDAMPGGALYDSLADYRAAVDAWASTPAGTGEED